MTYKTSGTCAREINFEIENDVITDINFVSGCPGNLLGISQLVKGLSVDEIIDKFDGLNCGPRSTSCPDQLAQALKKYKKGELN